MTDSGVHADSAAGPDLLGVGAPASANCLRSRRKRNTPPALVRHDQCDDRGCRWPKTAGPRDPVDPGPRRPGTPPPTIWVVSMSNISDATLVMRPDELRLARELSVERLEPPLHVPGYEQEAFLGKGSFGEAWRA